MCVCACGCVCENVSEREREVPKNVFEMKSELFDVTTTRHKDDVLLQPFFSPKKIIKKNLDKKVFFKVTKNSKQMCKVMLTPTF